MTAMAVTDKPSGESIQTYARVAGVLGLITLVAGGFGEAYVPGQIIVAGNAAATADNLRTSETLFRWGFAAYMVEALCDVGLTMLFFVLFRPVHWNLALLSAYIRIISTAGFAAAMVLYFGASQVARSADQLSALTATQQAALTLVLMKMSGFGQSLFSMFYGAGSLILGWLMYRSGFVPRILGALMATMGIAFMARTFLLVLAPAFASPLLLATGALAFPPLTFWLLWKGVDVAKWQDRVRRTPNSLAGLA